MMTFAEILAELDNCPTVPLDAIEQITANLHRNFPTLEGIAPARTPHPEFPETCDDINCCDMEGVA